MMKKRIFAGVLALLMVCGMLSGCAAREAERWDVLATTGPVWSMTGALLEGTGLSCGRVITESVSCLHDYTLTVAQMEKIGRADVVVLNGLGLEDFMEDALQTAKQTITASTGVETLPGEDGDDPHIWLDPAMPSACAGISQTVFPPSIRTSRCRSRRTCSLSPQNTRPPRPTATRRCGRSPAGSL